MPPEPDCLFCAIVANGDHAVVLEPFQTRNLGDETKHGSSLTVGEGRDVAERVDVPFGQDEKVGRRLRSDVADSDESLCGVGDEGVLAIAA